MKRLLTYLCLLLTTTAFAQTATYNIGMLLDHRSGEIDPLIVRLQDQIKAVVGEDAHIVFPEEDILTSDYSIEKARQNYAALVDRSDIILSFGLTNSLVVSNQETYPKPTILFGQVNTDLQHLDLTKETSGIPNLTYQIRSQSFYDDLKTFKELTEFEKVGVAIENEFVDLLPIEEILREQLDSLGADFKVIPFRTVNDITSNLEGIDAIYLSGGFYLSDEDVKQLATAFIDKKLPSFTVNAVRDVEHGIMATNQSESNLDQFMRRTALNILRYVDGMPMKDIPVYIEFNRALTVNYNTAEAVGMPIKYSLINEANFVGELMNINAKRTYDLYSLMEEVTGRNLALQASRQNIALSEQNVKSAKANYLPLVTAGANVTYTDPRLAEISLGNTPEIQSAGSVTIQQTIFNAQATANKDIQTSLLKAQEQSYSAEELNTILNVSSAYFNTLILKTNAIIQLQNINLTKKNLEIAEQKFQAGQSSKTDVLRFRSQLAQNTQSMVQAVNQVEQSFISLNQLMNNPIDMEIDVQDATLDDKLFRDYNYDNFFELLDDPRTREPFINFLVEEAKINSPELKSLDYNLEATERNIALSKNGRFLPTVALQGQYNQVFNRSGKGSTPPEGFGGQIDNNYNVALNLSMPIFNQNLNNINEQTARIQKEQLELNRANSQLNIAANVRSSILNVVNQISNIELSKVSENAAKESLELTQEMYRQGAVNFVQLIDIQNNYLSAQLARANAVYNFLMNAVQMERNVGKYFMLQSEAESEAFRQRFRAYLLESN